MTTEQEILLKEIVKNGGMANFTHAKEGKLYYRIEYNNPEQESERKTKKFFFPINMLNIEDTGTATFDSSIKTITLMRYIRKAMEKDELVVL